MWNFPPTDVSPPAGKTPVTDVIGTTAGATSVLALRCRRVGPSDIIESFQ